MRSPHKKGGELSKCARARSLLPGIVSEIQEDLTGSLLEDAVGIMMAEIETPPSAPSPTFQKTYGKTYGNRPTGAAIITVIAGIWAAFNGYILFIAGNYFPFFTTAMMLMGLGVGNILMGLVCFFAAYNAYNMKSSGKGLGIGANIIIIIMNIIIMAIGLLGIGLCIVSIIALAMWNP